MPQDDHFHYQVYYTLLLEDFVLENWKDSPPGPKKVNCDDLKGSVRRPYGKAQCVVLGSKGCSLQIPHEARPFVIQLGSEFSNKRSLGGYPSQPLDINLAC